MQHAKSVHMIILMQPDLIAAVEFYKRLGLKLKFHLRDSWAEFILSSVKIGLCPTSAEPIERHTGIVLKVEDVQKTYQGLKDEITFIAAPLEKVHGIMASIKDPGGNIIDLYQPTPEKVTELVRDVAQKDCCDDNDCVFSNGSGSSAAPVGKDT